MQVLAGVKGAIIDLDGTMLDTLPDFQVAINGMRADFGLTPISQEQIGLMVGKGSEHLIRSVLALDWDAAAIEQHIDAAMDAYQHHYLAINGQHSNLFPDVIAGLGYTDDAAVFAALLAVLGKNLKAKHKDAAARDIERLRAE